MVPDFQVDDNSSDQNQIIKRPPHTSNSKNGLFSKITELFTLMLRTSYTNRFVNNLSLKIAEDVKVGAIGDDENQIIERSSSNSNKKTR